MRQNHLKKSLQRHINSKSLSASQIDQLMALQQHESLKPSKHRPEKLRWAASFAMLLIMLSGSLFMHFSEDISLEQSIGNEVAKNHIQLKPLEIQASSLQTIRQYFTELEFSPIESSLLTQVNKTLIGGRYCSIQGVTAAQLRLKNEKTGQVQSLYQTLYKPEIFKGLPQMDEGEKPIIVYSKGLAIEIWVEKGLLFALTHDVGVQGR